jgi:hypothetical protein
MNETEWLTSSNPYDLLTFLDGRCSNRKLRLFAAACCQRAGSREVADLCARCADGVAGPQELALIHAVAEVRMRQRRAWGAHWRARRASPGACTAHLEWQATQPSAAEAALGAARTTIHEFRAAQCRFLRDLVGNLFQPVVVRGAWLAWEGGIVRRMAAEVYEEGAGERLPVLADALEDAGCDSEALLCHCREPGEHLRGCWAVDALLGKS